MKRRRPYEVFNPSNFLLAGGFLVLVGMVSIALMEILLRSFGFSLLLLSVLLLAVFFILGAVSSHRATELWAKVRQSRYPVTLFGGTLPPIAKGLVVLVSPRKERNVALEAAVYHIRSLEHLWMIASVDSRDTATWIGEQIRQSKPHVKVHSTVVLDDPDLVAESKLKVEAIRAEAIKVHKIHESELVCDFTGMFKPTSAGMILACASEGALMQYMYAPRDGKGELVPDAQSLPLRIEISYQPFGDA